MNHTSHRYLKKLGDPYLAIMEALFREELSHCLFRIKKASIVMIEAEYLSCFNASFQDIWLRVIISHL